MVAPGLDAFRVACFKLTFEVKDRLRLLKHKDSILFFSHIGLRGDGARRSRRGA